MNDTENRYPELQRVFAAGRRFGKIRNKSERQRRYEQLKFEIERTKILLDGKEYEEIIRLLSGLMRL